MGDKVQVAVRVRPLNKREIDLGAQIIVDMDKNQTILYHPKSEFGLPPSSKQSHSKHEAKTFAFDHCFWSVDEQNGAKFVGQKQVFESLGNNILERAFEGYNACILAYGQTGSGKSYTMMGSRGEQKGIIPRLCDALFERVTSAAHVDNASSFKVQVSYMEIYNEKVRDLLDPNSGRTSLTVREHSILGPYVDGLSQLAVKSYTDVETLLAEGNKSRTVAATNMNSESSRSHAVFTVALVHTLCDRQSGVSGERASKMSLVDLAGSERASKTGAIGERLREGANINRSLSTLGLVVKALAEQGSMSGDSRRSSAKFVPYRDSVLTWLLKDNLGGNSKTVMIATVSPSADNYEETLSTLRYADSAKRIVNHAIVNEDPNARIIRELRHEVEELRERLQEAEGLKAPSLKEKLNESERLIKNISKTWEERLQETERIHTERQGVLENMGIFVESSGIKVDTGKCFLVNLNADPSLNELLVYYLKEHTKVGRGDDNVSARPDIRLDGVGILPSHCVLDIVQGKVFVTPVEDARTCVNGVAISQQTRVRHGDRLLWGNNHFFRMSCPKEADELPSAEVMEVADYDFAQRELMQQEMSDDPIHEAIDHMERKCETSYMPDMLEPNTADRNDSSSLPTPSPMPANFNQCRQSEQGRSAKVLSGEINMADDAMGRRKPKGDQDRVDIYKKALSQLRNDLCRARALAREANMLAASTAPLRSIIYEVSLQIPASELSPNGRKRGVLRSEPAILARRKGYSDQQQQLYTMTEFEGLLVTMRDFCLYKCVSANAPCGMSADDCQDDGPFAVSSNWHDLIGVASIYLDVLLHDVALDYQAAIVSQHGELAGRLHVMLSGSGGGFSWTSSDEDMAESGDEISDDGMSLRQPSTPKRIVIKVTIKDAKDLPPALANFVFCQYKIWGTREVIIVPPALVDVIDEEDSPATPAGYTAVKFNRTEEFAIDVSEEFVDHVVDGGVLSIEVYGHRLPKAALEPAMAIAQWPPPLAARWAEVMRHLELRVEILELDDMGEYQTVELRQKPNASCGGIFQLRQGYSRRVRLSAVALPGSGALPLSCESFEAVCVGGVCARSELQRSLDSYHEHGLELLRTRWGAALDKRKAYLDNKMKQDVALAESKSEVGIENESHLAQQWDALIAEMDAMCSPAEGSGIPGALNSHRALLFGAEQHTPVIFLDMNANNGVNTSFEELPCLDDDDSNTSAAVGEQWLLDKEEGTTFVQLPIVHRGEDSRGTQVVVSWDSSMHESLHLNRTTPPNERVYVTVKAYVRLSRPAALSIVLRKRVCICVYKKTSLSDRLRRSLGSPSSVHNAASRTGLTRSFLHTPGSLLGVCSIVFEVVSGVPKACEELESGQALAKLAAASADGRLRASSTADKEELRTGTALNESYVEKYLQSVAAVESIITMDKLGQEAAIRESLLAAGRPARQFGSSPSLNAVVRSSGYLFSPSGKAVTSAQTVRPYDSVRDLSTRSPRKQSPMAVSGRAAPTPDNQRLLTVLPRLEPEVDDPKMSSSRHIHMAVSVMAAGRDLTRKPLQAYSPAPLSRGSSLSSVNRSSSLLGCFGGGPRPDDDDDAPYSRVSAAPSTCNTSSSAAPDTVRTPFSAAPDIVRFPSPTAPYIVRSPSSAAPDIVRSQSSAAPDIVRSPSSAAPDIVRSQSSAAPNIVCSPSSAAPDIVCSPSSFDADYVCTSSSAAPDSVRCTSAAPESVHSPSSAAPGIVHSPSASADSVHSPSFASADSVLSKSSAAADSVRFPSSVAADSVRTSSSAAQDSVRSPHSAAADCIHIPSQTLINVPKVGAEIKAQVLSSVSLIREQGEVVLTRNMSSASIRSSDERPGLSPSVAASTAVEATEDNREAVKADGCAAQDKRLDLDFGVPCNDGKSTTNILKETINTAAAITASSIRVQTSSIVGSQSTASLKEALTAASEAVTLAGALTSDPIAEPAAPLHVELVSPSQPDAATSLLAFPKLQLSSPAESANGSLAAHHCLLTVPAVPSLHQLRLSLATTALPVPSRLELLNDIYSVNALEELEAMEHDDDGDFSDSDSDSSSVPAPIKDGKSGGSAFRGASRDVPIRPTVTNDEESDDSASSCSFGSRADLITAGDEPPPQWVRRGASVVVLSTRGDPPRAGVVQSMGETVFAPGIWIGVQLSGPHGKNDGCVRGVRYFRCPAKHGIFVRHDRLLQNKKDSPDVVSSNAEGGSNAFEHIDIDNPSTLASPGGNVGTSVLVVGNSHSPHGTRDGASSIVVDSSGLTQQPASYKSSRPLVSNSSAVPSASVISVVSLVSITPVIAPVSQSCAQPLVSINPVLPPISKSSEQSLVGISSSSTNPWTINSSSFPVVSHVATHPVASKGSTSSVASSVSATGALANKLPLQNPVSTNLTMSSVTAKVHGNTGHDRKPAAPPPTNSGAPQAAQRSGATEKVKVTFGPVQSSQTDNPSAKTGTIATDGTQQHLVDSLRTLSALPARASLPTANSSRAAPHLASATQSASPLPLAGDNSQGKGAVPSFMKPTSASSSRRK